MKTAFDGRAPLDAARHNARMPQPTPFVTQFPRCLQLLARFALLALVGLLPIACKAQPAIGPGQWYVGKSTLTGDATMFGGAGNTAVMWQLPATTTNWIWRVSTNGTTREWAVEQRYANANDDPSQGQVWWMGDSTGSWSGTMSINERSNEWGGTMRPPFNAFTIAGVPANGDGHIEGHGQKVSEEVFLTLQWIKADGTVGATYKMEALGQNEQEYLQAIDKMGATRPATVDASPQRSY